MPRITLSQQELSDLTSAIYAKVVSTERYIESLLSMQERLGIDTTADIQEERDTVARLEKLAAKLQR